MNVIEVKNLKKYFGKTKAVDDVSFSVEKGEIFGFLGPNGAGKTTLIRCLMGFINPTFGEIKLFDQKVGENFTPREKIGYLPGSMRLYDGWTGEDHINFIKDIKGLKDTPADLISKLSFDPKIKAKSLSTGNRQKLGLILAMMAKPQLLILDEPTNGLDPLLQNIIYEILEKLKKDGATVFISSHNLSEVERLCTRVGIIKQGKIVALENINNLEKKKIHQIRVYFKGSFRPEDFQTDGIEIKERFSDGLHLIIKGGDIDLLIKKLAKYDLRDLEIGHATLEEVFLEFYHITPEKSKFSNKDK